MPIKLSLRLHHGGAQALCSKSTCHHIDAQKCLSTKYDVPIEWLYEVERCECPCHPLKSEGHEYEIIGIDEAI